jgi:hypothetical protein
MAQAPFDSGSLRSKLTYFSMAFSRGSRCATGG